MTAVSVALAGHQLVTAGWRVIRPEDEPDWLACPVGHWRHTKACPCRTFVALGDALEFALRGGVPTVEQAEQDQHRADAFAAAVEIANHVGWVRGQGWPT